LAEVKSPVLSHKINDFVKLPVYQPTIVADHRHRNNRRAFTVLMVNLGDRDIEPALQSPDYAFDDAPLSLERAYPVQIKHGFHHADNHLWPRFLILKQASSIVLAVLMSSFPIAIQLAIVGEKI